MSADSCTLLKLNLPECTGRMYGRLIRGFREKKMLYREAITAGVPKIIYTESMEARHAAEDGSLEEK